MEISRSEIIRHFQRCKLRLSEQRLLIYGYLLEHRTHPAAEGIYRALAPDHPSLSLTTVYNTLRMLAEHRLIQPVMIEDGQVRYDADTTFHAHFKCRLCGKIYDIPLKKPERIEMPDDAGFVTETMHLDYYGQCPQCR